MKHLTTKSEQKFQKVMHEFGKGELKSHGQPVTDQRQALAIAYGEARKVYPNYGMMKKGGDTEKVAVPGLFSLDAIEGKTFKGYTFGDDWNGWATPYFESEETNEIAHALGGRKVYDKPSYFLFPEEGPGSDLTDGPYKAETIKTVDGDKYVYPIGAYNWTWTNDLLRNGGGISDTRAAELAKIYREGTAKQLWEAWTPDNRIHFLMDHAVEFFELMEDNFNKYSNSYSVLSYDALPSPIKKSLAIHHAQGMYGNGGGISRFWDTTKKHTKTAFQKSKELAGKGYEKTKAGYNQAKEYTKGKIHDKKKEIALDVLDEARNNTDTKDHSRILHAAANLVEEQYGPGGEIQGDQIAAFGNGHIKIYIFKKDGKFSVYDGLNKNKLSTAYDDEQQARAFMQGIEQGIDSNKVPKYVKGRFHLVKLNDSIILRSDRKEVADAYILGFEVAKSGKVSDKDKMINGCGLESPLQKLIGQLDDIRIDLEDEDEAILADVNGQLEEIKTDQEAEKILSDNESYINKISDEKEIERIKGSISEYRNAIGNPGRSATEAYIDVQRRKYVLIDTSTKKLWANEYFDTMDEIKQFAKQNNIKLVDKPSENKILVSNLINLQDSLHDFSNDPVDVEEATKDFYKDIVGKKLEVQFDNGWKEFKKTWAIIQKEAPKLDEVKSAKLNKKWKDAFSDANEQALMDKGGIIPGYNAKISKSIRKYEFPKFFTIISPEKAISGTFALDLRDGSEFLIEDHDIKKLKDSGDFAFGIEKAKEGGIITSFRDIPYNEVEDYADDKALNIQTEGNFKEAAMALFNEKYAPKLANLSPKKKKLLERIQALQLTKSSASESARSSIQKKIDLLQKEFNYNPSVKERAEASKGKFAMDVPVKYSKAIYKKLWSMNMNPRILKLDGKASIVVSGKINLDKAHEVYANMLKAEKQPVPSLSKISRKL